MKGEYITVILTWLEKKINELKQLLLCHFYVTFYYPLAYFDSYVIKTGTCGEDHLTPKHTGVFINTFGECWAFVKFESNLLMPLKKLKLF